MTTTNLNIQVDTDLKEQSEQIFNELGLSISAAFTIFLRQTVLSNGMPFELRLSTPRFNAPNDETLAAINDVNLGRYMSGSFYSVKELMEDLDADD
jgi:DNA-damage-inducible protein J